MTYVTSIQGDTVLLERLGPGDGQALDTSKPVDHPEIAKVFAYTTEAELARILSSLRDEGVAFVSAEAGWPPAAVFEHLRARGLVVGPYLELGFSGPGKWRTRSK